MKNLLIVSLLIAGGFSHAFSQKQSSADYPKFEFYAGFSHNRAETVLGGNPLIRSDGRASLNGLDLALTHNVSRYVGIQFDFAAHFGEETFRLPCLGPCPDPPPQVKFDSSLYTVLGGIQIKDNARSTRFKPFARVLLGAARVGRSDDPLDKAPPCVFSDPPCNKSESGFAAVLGCGLDMSIGRRVDIRVIQLDYNPMRLSGTTLHNMRVGFGINIH